MISMPYSHRPPFLVGERVVFQNGGGEHEAGFVRWLGCLPGQFNSDMVVGIEAVSIIIM